ncbi:hypothetical protein BCR43DRAFT_488184 [Syncephalastrum racemosum]|uniref:Uncharacterized protein n=1 Tax=Syncephalastrum racemosum TaxID=13706 RepID=A0A1X2HJM0_SYNRA|nr:hypothetical protein BCR43DRAFT_488184 [Syncephalastrum racemosum]
MLVLLISAQRLTFIFFAALSLALFLSLLFVLLFSFSLRYYGQQETNSQGPYWYSSPTTDSQLNPGWTAILTLSSHVADINRAQQILENFTGRAEPLFFRGSREYSNRRRSLA